LLGFKRNLTAQEIAAQFLHLKKRESEISHIVLMGMGEPLLNLDELRKALSFFMDPNGLNISKRRITLSTAGIPNGILELAKDGPDIRLAFSLISARQGLRDRLMPISRENPLVQIKEALLKYQGKKERRLTLEMVLLAGINTCAQEAKAAADFASGLNAVFNLIPWNQVPGMEFEGKLLRRPEKQEIFSFVAALESHGLKVTQRIEKGRRISGACGQLGILLFSSSYLC
jgi:23S rRNA (adenine2503-C2)-methyltransferase